MTDSPPPRLLPPPPPPPHAPPPLPTPDPFPPGAASPTPPPLPTTGVAAPPPPLPRPPVAPALPPVAPRLDAPDLEPPDAPPRSGDAGALRRYWRWWVIGILVALVATAVIVGPPDRDAAVDAGAGSDTSTTAPTSPDAAPGGSAPGTPGTPDTSGAPGGTATSIDAAPPSTGVGPVDLYPCAPADDLDVLAITGTLTNDAVALGPAFAYTDGMYRWVVADLLDAAGRTVAIDGAWVLSAGQVATISESAALHSMVPAALDVFVGLPLDAGEVSRSLYDCAPG